ncbi:MAG TPA: Mrp/NBP35 family ATP-binding protein, partial [Phycisphaerae bacterium]|nr:Mrp/NBP35 family ATP-binding protein [Phycisphaerae bacterium]
MSISGSPTKEQVIDILRQVNDPELHRDLVSLNMIKNVAVCDGNVRVAVELTTPACPLKDKVREDVLAAVRKLPGVANVEVEFSARVRSSPFKQAMLPGVKNVLAVGAGKGGVGKSTLSVLTAVGLARAGARVGLLDADVYGPSIPKMLGVENARPKVAGENKIIPIVAQDLKLMSVGFLIEPERAVVVRGPMAHGLIRDFLEKVEWGDLDYLIVDLPPGTGDVPLTLSQSLPLNGAVVVCTPQEVALLDAVRAARMYQMLNVEVLGIVENMSYFIAPDTGKEYDLFGKGGAEKAAARLKVPFLGSIPINVAIRKSGD